MKTDIKAPVFPESIADGVIALWRKKIGDFVLRDEVLAEIETDKVVLEVPAPQDGTLVQINKVEGDTVLSAEVMAIFEAGSGATTQLMEAVATPTTATQADNAAPQHEVAAVADLAAEQAPSVRKLLAENPISATDIVGTGRGERITKQDVLAQLAKQFAEPATVQPTEVVKVAQTEVAAATAEAATSQVMPAAAKEPVPASKEPHQAISTAVGQRIEKRVPMTRLRSKVAERLLAATQQTAMLTTFNEVNMQPVMDLRKDYGDRFEKRHGVRLGFMSFFTKAASEALKRFPAVNASIDGGDIVYHGYYDIGVAVSSDRGLVVPVLKDTDQMSFAEVEKAIGDFGVKARDGKLALEDMLGGTFTITNGGVFGSLLSTPIINPPQTAILGMHKIQQRPIAENGQVVIAPMMYLALSYDHRLIDGKEAVQFLLTIKELVEDPAMLLLDL